jgi:hypothetical protein
MLSFLRDPSGVSPAREEADLLRRQYPAEFARLLAHLSAVDASVSSGRHQTNALRQAQLYPGTSGVPDLYWWDIHGLGAFYIVDDKNIVVVLMGRVGNPPAFQDVWTSAQARL